MASGGQSAKSLPLLLVVLLFLSGHACLRVGALTVDDLYPFGANNGDTVIKGGDDVSSGLIALPYPVPVFGVQGVSGAYVNLNGAVHFRSPNTDWTPDAFPVAGAAYSMVAPFWTDLWASCAGCTGMGFRAVDDAALLADITSDIRDAFPTEALATSFTAESALIATWINVTLYATRFSPEARIHTFQAVIAFNTHTVFAGLLLPELTYTGPGAGAEGGFNLGDGKRSFRLPTSFSTASFDELSNVGQAGKWWFGLDQISNATVGTFAYIDQPAAIFVCGYASLLGEAGLDTCGNPRVMDWDFNNDGIFDDATGTTTPIIDATTLRLTPGTHPIRARVSSPSPCPGVTNDPQVVSTILNVINSNPTLRISSISLDPATGNPKPYGGEAVRVSLATSGVIFCNDVATSIDCGNGSTASQAGCQPQLPCLQGICQYSTPGNYTITATITQNGLSASGSLDITVVEYKQACSSQEYPPDGRAVGRRGCTPYQWTYSTRRCNYPVATAGIKPYTPLWAAFASRSAEDAAVIRRFYGNRTMAEALNNFSPYQINLFAKEAAAALLNTFTLPYPQCPTAVKAKFRHALYSGVDSDEARTVYALFRKQNNRGYNGGCTLPVCA